MYYPVQNPDIFNEVYRENVDYVEHKRVNLQPAVICIWTMYAEKKQNLEYINTIFPDACIDIIIDFTTRTIGVSGTGKATTIQEQVENIDAMGVRFSPGVIHELMGKDASEFIDVLVQFSDLKIDQSLYEILDIKDARKRMHFLETYLQRILKEMQESKWTQLVHTVYGSQLEEKFRHFVQSLNYSEKTVQRLFLTHFGFTPKALLNILRLHLSLQALIDGETDLVDISTSLGFYDQAHFSKEIKKYCHITAKEFMELNQ